MFDPQILSAPKCSSCGACGACGLCSLPVIPSAALGVCIDCVLGLL